MTDPLLLATAAVVLTLGGLLGWLFQRARSRAEAASLHAQLEARDSRLAEITAERDSLRADLTHHRERVTRLETEAEALNHRLAELAQLKEQFTETFRGLSGEALRQNNETFFKLAEERFKHLRESTTGDLEKRQQAIDALVKPLREGLSTLHQNLGSIEKARAEAQGSLRQQLQALTETSSGLQRETANLVGALRKPGVRGTWGEMQLRRAVEFAGMTDRCDFQEQASTNGDSRQRPDLIVHLPGGRQVVVDAKAPMEAYLAAIEADDPTARTQHLLHHARQLGDKIKDLGRKSYWEQFQPAPEFVVLFLPNEALFAAALEQNPSLVDLGARERVILCTPTTLIALLLAIAYGWKQEHAAENAARILENGSQLHERLGTFLGHLSEVGKALTRTVDHYNRAVSSAESRLLVTARRMEELGAGKRDSLPDPSLVDRAPVNPSSTNEQP